MRSKPLILISSAVRLRQRNAFARAPLVRRSTCLAGAISAATAEIFRATNGRVELKADLLTTHSTSRARGPSTGIVSTTGGSTFIRAQATSNRFSWLASWLDEEVIDARR